ncbi:MAG: hypothetical protein ABI673_02645 [Novosphingobium sp.]
MKKSNKLRIRYGSEFITVIGLNLIILSIAAYGITRNGFGYLLNNYVGFSIFSILGNIAPLVILCNKFSNRINFDGLVISANPYKLIGSCSNICVSKLESVDIKLRGDISGDYDSINSPSFIVFYGNSNFLALDPLHANRTDFNNLIEIIYELSPSIFTENAKKFVDESYLDPPHSNAEGEFVW